MEFKTWPNRPNCGYFFDGAYYYGADQAYTSLAYAVVAKLGEYNENITGLSRERAKKMAIKAIRYLCFTHDTGPEDCVRVKGKNPLTSGTKWGGKDHGFFQATQVGNSLMNLGLACWLLWDDLDGETRNMVFNIFSTYADKWSGERPRNGVYMDTQAEENGWTAAGIAVAAVLFGDHPRANIWHQGVLKWALNCASTVEDWSNTDIINGKPLNQQVFTVTFHPDYTAENHKFVHPNYMGAPIEHTGIITLYTKLAGIKDFPKITRNIEKIYDKTLRIWSSVDGSPIPLQSQDWWYYNVPRAAGVNAYMNVLFKNTDASYLERLSLDIIAKVQDGNKNGCIYEVNPEKCVVSRGYQDIGDMENRAASHISLIYLLHYFSGNGVEPQTEEQFYKDISGVHCYPYGSIIAKQAPSTFASLSWRNSAMAVTMPKHKLFTITTPPSSTFGNIAVKGEKNEQFQDFSKNILKIKDEKIVAYDNGFSVIGEIERGDGKIRQNMGFVALPQGNTVYFEKLNIDSYCEIVKMETGLVGIRNDSKEGITKYLKGYRDVYIYTGDDKDFEKPAERFYGWYGGDHDDISRWKDVKRVNLDNQISYLLHNSMGVTYVNRHCYPKWKGVEDFLILNDRGKDFVLNSGDELPPFILYTVPNTDAKEMKEIEFLVCETGDDNLQITLLEDYLVFTNFNIEAKNAMAKFDMVKGKLNLYRGNVLFNKGLCQWRGHLKGRECGFIEKYSQINLISDPDHAIFEVYINTENSSIIRNIGTKIVFKIGNKMYELEQDEVIYI